MAQAFRHCAAPHCTALVLRGYCDIHRRQREMRRGSSNARGYTRQWGRVRDAFLARHPLCVQCEREGRAEAARVVDHIVPHRGDQRLFWDENNWQQLCKRHHDVKTSTVDHGFGR